MRSFAHAASAFAHWWCWGPSREHPPCPHGAYPLGCEPLVKKLPEHPPQATAPRGGKAMTAEGPLCARHDVGHLTFPIAKNQDLFPCLLLPTHPAPTAGSLPAPLQSSTLLPLWEGCTNRNGWAKGAMVPRRILRMTMWPAVCGVLLGARARKGRNRATEFGGPATEPVKLNRGKVTKSREI